MANGSDGQQEDDDTQPLLDDKPLSTSSKPRIVRPKRLIVIEPVMAMVALAGLPLIQMTQQFVYQEITRQLAVDYGLPNISLIPPTTQSPCNITSTENGTTENISQKSQVASSRFLVLLGFATAVPAFFVTIFIGAYSDKAGRRYILILSFTGLALRTLVFTVVALFQISIWWLMLGAFLDGFGGSYHCILGGCYAYIADTSTPEQRLFRITTAELCLFISSVATPAGIGYWIQAHGFGGPFLFVLAVMIVGLMYTVFCVPETVVPVRRVRFFSTTHVARATQMFVQKDTETSGTSKRQKFALLLIAFAIASMCFNGAINFFFLFLMNEPLCWGSAFIGIFSVFYLGLSSIGAAIFARVFRRFTRDEIIVLVAALACMVERTYTGFVQNSVMMFMVPVVSGVSFLLLPTLRALLSKLALETEQGGVFGGIACLEVLINFLGSTIFTMIYSETQEIYPGLAFFIMGMFYLVAIIILSIFNVLRSRENRSVDVLSQTTVKPTE